VTPGDERVEAVVVRLMEAAFSAPLAAGTRMFPALEGLSSWLKR
jgi:hypothetical protein